MEEFVQTLLESMPYLGLAIVLMLTGMGLPVPEDIPLLISGALCGLGKANVYIMIPVAIFFTVFSDCILYFIGRRYGHHAQKFPMLRRYVDEKHLARAEVFFSKHGGKTLFLSRFMPGIRAALYVSAGMFRVEFWKMIVFDGGAALISVPAWILIAYFFANNWEEVQKMAGRLQVGIIGFVVVLVIAFIIWQWRTKRDRSDDSESPNENEETLSSAGQPSKDTDSPVETHIERVRADKQDD